MSFYQILISVDFETSEYKLNNENKQVYSSHVVFIGKSCIVYKNSKSVEMFFTSSSQQGLEEKTFEWISEQKNSFQRVRFSLGIKGTSYLCKSTYKKYIYCKWDKNSVFAQDPKPKCVKVVELFPGCETKIVEYPKAITLY